MMSVLERTLEVFELLVKVSLRHVIEHENDLVRDLFVGSLIDVRTEG